MKTFKVFGALLAMLFLVSACGTVQSMITKTELTPAARYYDALKTFNSNVEQYNAIYKLSDPATQAKWKANIDPLIKVASSSLDSWKNALNTPSAIEKEQAWNSAKTNLITILVSSGIIKIEGGK